VAIGAGICAVAVALYALRLRTDLERLRSDLRIARKAGVAGSRFGLPVGIEAPAFVLEDMRGQPATLTGLLERGQPVLLMFMSPWCGPCAAMVPKVQGWQQTLQERLTIGIISTGTTEQNAPLEEQGLEHVLLQEEMEVADAYHVTGTPSAVLVTAGGKIASNKGEMDQGIETLVRVALRQGVNSLMEGSVA
jgi:thiol-disulfide isomerase/thioredoxin